MKNLQIGTVFNAVDKVSGVVNKISGNVNKFAASASRANSGLMASFGGLTRVMGAMGVALSVGALTQQVKAFATTGDEIAKTSTRLGLSGQALQELRHAASLSDVSTVDLNSALGTLNKGMGQLRSGTGRLNKMLGRLDPNLKANLLNAKDTDQAFMMAMDAINGTGNAMDKAAIAAALFGGAGEKVLTLAKEGPGGIAALRKEFVDMGGVIGEDSTSAAELFNDTLERLGVIMTGLKNAVLGPLLKAITPLLVAFQQWIMANRALMASNVTGAVDALSAALGGLFSVLGQVISAALWINDLFGGTLFPLILAGVVAFKAITMAIAAYNIVLGIMAAAKLAAASAGSILNIVMLMNPIGLVIAAVVALIAVVILIIKNWDKIAEFFSWLWEKIKEYFFVALNFIKDLFLKYHPIGIVISHWRPILRFFVMLWEKIKQYFFIGLDFIKNLFLKYHPVGIIIRHWKPIISFFQGFWASIKSIFSNAWIGLSAIIDRITARIAPIIAAARALGGAAAGLFGGGGGGGAVVATVPPSGGSGGGGGQSTLDVNLNNLPAGTTTQQRGQAPNINVNLGFAAP